MSSQESLRKAVTDHLRGVAEAKATQIETYARERRRDVTALARLPGVANGLGRPLDRSTAGTASRRASTRLRTAASASTG